MNSTEKGFHQVTDTNGVSGCYGWHKRYAFLVRQCEILMEELGWELPMSHCYREANQATNKLANMWVGCAFRLVMYRSPLLKLLVANIVGVSWPQLINE